MNRRGFIQLASAALASIPLVRHAVAREPAISSGSAWGGLVTADGFGKAGAHFKLATRPTVKVTGVWTRPGFESVPYECEVNDAAYIELPEITHTYSGQPLDANPYIVFSAPPDAYRIYAPLEGFGNTGPCYFLREVSYRDAKRARFTIAVEYQNADLRCQLAPGEYERLKGEI